MDRIILKKQIVADLRKSLDHLKYSYSKAKKIDFGKKDWSEDELEVLESFSSRFARTSDMFVSRYLRFLVHDWDPAFRGTIIDLLNISEKFGSIKSASQWLRIRELRNVAAHDYEAKDIKGLYLEILNLTPVILDIEEGINEG